MSDVFATVLIQEQHRADAIVVADGAMSFIPQFTTNLEGAPPPTHRMSSGFIPQTVKDALAADGRFIVSNEPWTVVAAANNVTRVVFLD